MKITSSSKIICILCGIMFCMVKAFAQKTIISVNHTTVVGNRCQKITTGGDANHDHV